MSDQKQTDLSPVDFGKPPQRKWLIEITHWGENGELNQREDKIITATGGVDAFAQAKGWADARQNETGKPWNVTDVSRDLPISEWAAAPPSGDKDGCATKILRLTLADGAWFEKELPEELNNESACHFMRNNLPDNAADPVGLCQPLFAGSKDAYDLDDVLERVMRGRAEREYLKQEAYQIAAERLRQSDIEGLQSNHAADIITISIDCHPSKETISAPQPPTRRQKRIFFGMIITALIAAIVGFTSFFVAGASPWQVAVKLIVVTPVAFAVIGFALIGVAFRAGDMIACENYYAQIAVDWVKNLRETLAEDQEENDGKETEG